MKEKTNGNSCFRHRRYASTIREENTIKNQMTYIENTVTIFATVDRATCDSQICTGTLNAPSVKMLGVDMLHSDVFNITRRQWNYEKQDTPIAPVANSFFLSTIEFSQHARSPTSRKTTLVWNRREKPPETLRASRATLART